MWNTLAQPFYFLSRLFGKIGSSINRIGLRKCSRCNQYFMPDFCHSTHPRSHSCGEELDD